jgi:excinuclease ABC subunit B
VPFKLVSDFTPQGDQPRAIDALTASLQAGHRHQVLLGVTGSGKTFTIANAIARLDRPTLIISHNKVLAAQLYRECKAFFPGNAVEYFVSYYDYYMPEAYVPSTDTYIEKESTINDEIDRMRHAATVAVLERRDVIVVASVSCIYGIGDVNEYRGMSLSLYQGQEVARDEVLGRLAAMQYNRNDLDLHRGTFRVRGDVLEVYPASFEDLALRVEFFGDAVDRISAIDPLRGQAQRVLKGVTIWPGSHYAVSEARMKQAVTTIRDELGVRLEDLEAQHKALAADRLRQRTTYDLEMLENLGFCSGIENYSRHLTGRAPGEPPYTLIDFFPRDFVTIVDESHVTIPQIGSMYRGDRSRKETLIDFGFRLPSALDNRPLTFEEWEERVGQVVYLSATPADFELERARGQVIEQVIRPTGLLDPSIEIRPVTDQVDDLYGEIRLRLERGERVLVTTLTKRMAEELTGYYEELGLRVRYLHSDVETLERARLIYDLRRGVFDVLVGINLLREGLDIPEVSLVAILDADKEGFLRSERSLIQVCGRAARHERGSVILYADRVTGSMERAIRETNRRREVQEAWNREHGITPRGVVRPVVPLIAGVGETEPLERAPHLVEGIGTHEELAREIRRVEAEMKERARDLDFEAAIRLRDRLLELKQLHLAGG